ncbi:MAG: hypothetical protein FWF59_03070 [Turicibacter sp.]|nr:hypothetical protein [Turicibacter sp.]
MDGGQLKIIFPDHLKKCSITENAGLKTHNLKTVLNQILEDSELENQLKSKGKSCYRAYGLGEIEDILLESYKEEWPCIVKTHLLSKSPQELGSNAAAIYLIAYITQHYGTGKETFFRMMKELGIASKDSVIGAIWSTGQSDGQYLGVFNSDGTIRDKHFFQQWFR